MEEINSMSSKKVLNTYLKFEITDSFKKVDKKFLKKYNKREVFENLDDNTLVIDTMRILSAYAGGILSIFGFIILFILTPDNNYFKIPWVIFYTTLFLVFVLSLIYALTISKQYITLDRRNGLITFPKKLYGKPFTIEFDKAIVYWVGTGGSSGNIDMKLAIAYPDNKLLGTYLSAHVEPYYEIWSFYVWYMDRNRPLPPGDAFDPYRERDFLRRKAEGFPPPLYKSYVPTPEATPEQQKEREQYWTDEQYTEKFEREEGSTWYDPQIHNDWEETTYLKPETKTPVANRYVKFIFNDGRIIYSQTNEDGSLYEPPESENFEMQFIDLKK
ncbi:hypothetical protein Q4603_21955 [Zobellia galactanivorans]|uniref:hypothetical protein n=1 Tax=Zobellia galactanivorans (strain DSM 12802 / CCUG 47099 / CIP 106680 / NCIMB 13871 / Dsij) TaxID=63186 RepID=UPI0026E2AE68|nr:hypothetical protein [Zobellia galactanivorans]MDO6811295.1 hypothetical protein [Zobellia galactanivorans]